MSAGTVPSHPGGLSIKDCVVIPDFPEALCFAFRNDNRGPPENVQEVLGQYEVLRAEFPNAKLQASKLEDFILAVEPIREKLPVIKNEVGDTWIQGVASDPRKSAEVRAVGRVMRDCFRSGRCDVYDQRVWNSSRIFVKTFEHTWGLHELKDSIHWSNEQFQTAKKSTSFKNCVTSWGEQRQVLYYSIDALQTHPVVKDIQNELSALSPAVPDLSDYMKITDIFKTMTCPGGVRIQFGPDGSLQTFSYNGVEWASDKSQLGRFIYQTFNHTDFENMHAVYNYNGFSAGYYKRNVTANAHPQSEAWPVTLQSLYSSKITPCDVYLHLTMSDKTTWTDYGAPTDVWIRYTTRMKPKPGLDIVLQLFNKTTTRLPEAITFLFTPQTKPNSVWRMSKLGGWVDPHNVILNGSQYEHVLDDGGITYGTQTAPMIQLRSPDVPLAVLSIESLPQKSVFPYPLDPVVDTFTSVGFNIYNNIWDTNYIFWYPYQTEDRNFKARFSLDIM